jgi:hypothetical protein
MFRTLGSDACPSWSSVAPFDRDIAGIDFDALTGAPELMRDEHLVEKLSAGAHDLDIGGYYEYQLTRVGDAGSSRYIR